MQVVAQHPLGLQSLWDARLQDGNSFDGEAAERLFTTWKIRTEGQTQRVIDYIWCVPGSTGCQSHMKNVFNKPKPICAQFTLLSGNRSFKAQLSSAGG
jgi:hypothetical protein